MHLCLKSLSLAIATLLLSLSPSLVSTPHSQLPASAQTSTTQARKAEADRLLKQGEQQLASNKPQAALESFQKALLIYQEIREQAGQGQAFKNSGNAAYASGDYPKAIEYQQQALTIAREIGDRDLEGRALNNLGLIYRASKDSTKEIEYLQQALAAAQKSQNSQLELLVLTNLSVTYDAMSNQPAKVIEYGQPALQLARSLKQKTSEVGILILLCNAYIRLKEPQKVVGFAQQAMNIAQQINNSQQEALSSVLLSMGYFQLKDYTKTVEFGRRTLALGQSLNPQLRQTVSVAIAISYLKLNQERNATNTLQQLLETIETNGRKPTSDEAKKQAELIVGLIRLQLERGQEVTDITANPMPPVQAQGTAQYNGEAEAERLLQVARNYLKVGEGQKATEPALQAVEIARKSKKREIEGQAQAILARAYVELGRDQNAVVYARQALAIAREIENRELEGFALVWQALALSSSEEQQAIDLVQQAIEIAREIKNREIEAWGTFALASASEQKQGVDWAQKTVSIAREIQNPELEAWGLVSMASSYFQMGDYQKASNAAQAALKIARAIKHRTLEGYALGFYAFAAAGSGNHQAVVELTSQGTTIAKELKNQQIEMLAFTGLTISQMKVGEYQKAVETAQKAIKIARELQKANFEVAALKLQINSHLTLQDYQKALAPAQRLVAIAQEQKNREEEANGLSFLARVYVELKDYQKGIDSAQQLVAIAQAQKKQDYEAAGLLWLARAYIELKNYQKAIESAQKLVAIAQAQKKQDYEAAGLLLLARAYAGSGQSQLANTSVQQGEAIAQKLPDLKAKVTALLQVRYAYEVMGNPQKVDELAQQVLIIARQKDDTNLMWEVTNALASSRIRQSGDYKDLTELYEEYLALARRKGEVDTTKLSQLVLLYLFVLEDYSKAETIANYVLQYAREKNNRQQELGNLLLLTIIYRQAKDYPKLNKIANSDLPKFSQSSDPTEKGISSFISSMIFYTSKDYQKAIESMDEFIKLLPQFAGKNASKQDVALVVDVFRVVSALFQAKANRSQDAIAIVQDVLQKLDKYEARGNTLPLKAALLSVLAEVYRQSGENTKAIPIYREALSIPVPASGKESTNSTTPFSSSSDYRTISYAGLAKIYQRLNLPVTAITYYKQAVNQLEQKRKDAASNFLKSIPGQLTDLASLNLQNLSQNLFFKGSFGDLDERKNSDVYRELADVLLSQGRIAEAQQVLELLKVQELNDFARGTRSEYQLPEVGFNETETKIKGKHGSLIEFGRKLEECEQAGCAQLKQLTDEYDGLTQAFNQQIQTIEQQVADRRLEQVATGTEGFIAGANKIVTAQPNTVLIYPLVLPDKVRLLWASKGVLSSQVCNIGETELWQTVSEFRDLLKTPNSDIATVKATGKKLYDCLVKPLESELQKNNIQNLVFVPDRATNYIPMGALFDGEKFLIERYTVSSVLNAGLTDVSDRLPPNPQNIPTLALGLSEAKAGFKALPNVPLELDAIVRQQTNDTQGIYPGAEFLNQAFTLDALRNNVRDRKILHIATHGAFVSENPKESYLLLGNGDKYPIYQIQFLRNLRDVHLVVLSACETALGGPDANGTEIAGISSYFLRDKAKAVMASLWLVNDASTSLLMQQFYKNLSTDKQPITKAQALRQAQLSLLTKQVTAQDAPQRADADVALEAKPGTQLPTRSTPDFSHPYYWAPFILIGNSL
jgi:CHAT domain-containing protein